MRRDLGRWSWIVTLYILFLMIPIYWLIVISFKTTCEIMDSFSLCAAGLHAAQLQVIFTDTSWYLGYINSLIYVVMNMVFSIAVALPAAYAFSRYRFLGDKHLFFWLLTNRMAPAAVFALPFFQLYSAFGLIDTHIAGGAGALPVQRAAGDLDSRGFMSGVPKEIDETAYIDGYSFPRFFIKIFIPLIASGIGVAGFFCFMFSWVELLIARTLTTTDAKPITAVMTRRPDIGHGLGRAGCGGRADADPGRAGDLVRPQLHRQGLCPGPRLRWIYRGSFHVE